MYKNEKINQQLIKYFEEEIFPIYKTFDKGHDLNHINDVIERAIKIADTIDGINYNLVYASAVLHDIGIKIERKDHALYSATIIRNDKNLLNYFSQEEIETIANAAADHSTSKGIVPRSIYGKIICDADKDSNVEISLLRAYEFTKSYFPNYDEEECINNVYDQLCLKFGPKGKVKFYIGLPEQKQFLDQMKSLALDINLFNETIKKVLKKYY